MKLYPVLCSSCDEIYHLEAEEYDVLTASDEPFLCDGCFRKPVHLLPNDDGDRCRCKVHYGMTKSEQGPGYFADYEQGVYTDSSRCPLHG